MKNTNDDVPKNTDESADEQMGAQGVMLSANDPAVRGKVVSSGKKQLNDEELLESEFGADKNDTLNGVDSESVEDQLVSGEMPDPDSDDDTLLNSHQVGLRLDEDYDNPQPLDIAADVAAAEAERHGTSDVDEDDDDFHK